MNLKMSFVFLILSFDSVIPSAMQIMQVVSGSFEGCFEFGNKASVLMLLSNFD